MPLFVPKDRKSLFRQFLAGMYDAVVITDPNGHIIEINPRAEEHFGYTQDEVIDRPISVYIPGLAPEIVQRIRRGLDQDRHMVLDANGLNKDGSKFACEVTVSMIDLMDPGDLVFTVRNTERRRRQLEAFRSKENCFNVAQYALFACAPDGRFRWVNAAFVEMFGVDDDVQKYSFADFMDDEPLPTLFAQALAGEANATRIRAENAEGGEGEEVEIALAPDLHGKKVRGVVGSVFRV